MREFFDRLFKDLVFDLDDPNTYSYLPNDVKKLRDIMFKEIGYAHCYMNYLNKEYYDSIEFLQKDRVNNIVDNFCKNEKANLKNILWYKEQIFILQNEIDNMV